MEEFVKWPLQKYARLLQPCDLPTKTDMTTPDASCKNSDKWILFCSDNSDLSLHVTESLQLVITKGNVLMESMFMLNIKGRIHAITRGDSILFLSKHSCGTRQFRIKFDELDGRSGIEQCQACMQKLAKYIDVKTGQTNATIAPTILTDQVGVGKVAQAIIEPGKYALPSVYSGRSEEMTKESLQDAIAFCLADPMFPSFVEAVETCLAGMTSDGDASQEGTQNSTSFTS